MVKMTLVFAGPGQPAVGSGRKMRVCMQESLHRRKNASMAHSADPPAPFRGCRNFAVFAWLVLALANIERNSDGNALGSLIAHVAIFSLLESSKSNQLIPASKHQRLGIPTS